ncbi:MAG: hypothetical protein UU76_C0005G0019, partial [Parcubacteria group bacterium GW2011_GWC1_41_7]
MSKSRNGKRGLCLQKGGAHGHAVFDCTDRSITQIGDIVRLLEEEPRALHTESGVCCPACIEAGERLKGKKHRKCLRQPSPEAIQALLTGEAFLMNGKEWRVV